MFKEKDSKIKKVAVLVFNPCVFDNRVIKTSETLAKSKYQVTVLCKHDSKYKDDEFINNVRYLRKDIITNYGLSELLSFKYNSKILKSKKNFISFFLSFLFIPFFIFNLLDKYLSFLKSFHLGFKSFYKHSKKIINSLKRAFLKTFEIICKPIYELSKKIINSLERTFLKMFKIIFRPIYKHSKKIINSLKRAFLKTFEIICKPIYELSKKIINSLERTFLKMFKIIFRPIYKLSKKTIHRLKLIFNKLINKLEDFEKGGKIVSKFFYSQIAYYLRILDYLFLLKPDLVHANDLITLPIAGIYKILTKTNFVYDSHELEMHRNAKYNFVINIYRRICEKFFIHKANYVITVSESIAEHLKDFYRLKIKPLVIYNSPKLNKFLSESSNKFDLRDEIGLDKKSKILIYVGALTINRGLEKVLLSIKKIPDLNFVTLGPKNPKVFKSLLNKAFEHKIEKRVFLLDPVLPSEVLNYIKSADASILPIQNVCLSYYYCMPNKLFESVFAGLPVMVSDLKDMREFVLRYKCGSVVNIDSEKKLTKQIISFFENKEKYLLSTKNKNYLIKKYSWESQEIKLLDMYSSILEN